jgi:hypothetical protein
MRNRPASLAALLAASLLALPALGCIGLFRPAVPEPPIGTEGGGNLTLDYSAPDATLETIAGVFAFRTRVDAVAAYMSGFANPETDGVPFLVEFDPNVLGGRPQPTWTRSSEQTFYNSLFDLDSHDYLFVWAKYDRAPDDIQDEAAGRASRYRSYRLFAISDAGSTRLAAGRADLDLRKLPNGHWVITRWGDLVDPEFGPNPDEAGDRSFSRLRLDSPGGS